MWTADDKFFGAALATSLGIAHPENDGAAQQGLRAGHQARREPAQPDVSRSTGRRLLAYVGLPCVLKDAHGGGWQNVYICHNARRS